jgi:hypothetical protein
LTTTFLTLTSLSTIFLSWKLQRIRTECGVSQRLQKPGLYSLLPKMDPACAEFARTPEGGKLYQIQSDAAFPMQRRTPGRSTARRCDKIVARRPHRSRKSTSKYSKSRYNVPVEGDAVQPKKPVIFLEDTQAEIRGFSRDTRLIVGYALNEAALSREHPKAKPL